MQYGKPLRLLRLLPRLPEAARRRVRRRCGWALKSRGFAGNAHWGWLKDHVRLQQALKWRQVEFRLVPYDVTAGFRDRVTGAIINNQSDYEAWIAAIRNEKETEDRIGIEDTVGLAMDFFDALAREYVLYCPWAEFEALLPRIQTLALALASRVWRGRREWFVRLVAPQACPMIADAVTSAMPRWLDAAGEREPARLDADPAARTKGKTTRKPPHLLPKPPQQRGVRINGMALRLLMEAAGHNQKSLQGEARIGLATIGRAVKGQRRIDTDKFLAIVEALEKKWGPVDQSGLLLQDS